MQIVTGTVVDGKVVLDATLFFDGTVVTVYAEETAETVRLPPHLLAERHDAIGEADRVEGIPAEELFTQLKKYS